MSEYRKAYADALYDKAQSGVPFTDDEAAWSGEHYPALLERDAHNRLRALGVRPPSPPAPRTRTDPAELVAEVIVGTVQKSIAPLIADNAALQARIATLEAAEARRETAIASLQDRVLALEATQAAREADRVSD